MTELNLFNAIYGKLAGSALAGTIGTKLFDTVAKEGAEFPYAVFQVVSGFPEYTFTENFENASWQFSLFSSESSTTEILGMYNNLITLYDECSLTVTGMQWYNWMKRTNKRLMPEDHVTPDGTIPIFHYAVDYDIQAIQL